MKWFKVHNDIIHDPKIRALAFEDRWHFVALMALMNDGTLEESGKVKDTLIEVALGLHGVDLNNLKNRLMDLRLIGENWHPLQWDWRQAGSDPAHALRQRKYRESLKKKKGDVTRDARVTKKVTVEEEVEEEEEVNKGQAKPTKGQIQFEEFWSHVQKKQGKAKARVLFLKMKAQDREDAVAFSKSKPYADREMKYVPKGSTIVEERRWEDELTGDSQQNNLGGESYD